MDCNGNLTFNRPKWSWWDLFLVILALLTLMGFAAFLQKPIRSGISALGLTGSELQTFLLFFSTLLQSLVIISSVIFVTRRRGAVLRDLGVAGHNMGRSIITGFFGGILLGASIWILGILMSLIFGPPQPQEVEQWLTGIKTGKDMFWPFFAIAVLAPVSEELYFRGMVYPVVRGRFGPVMGMVLSGLFFGSMHLDLYRLIPIGAGGMVLAYLYEKTGSLLAPVIAHATWNSLMLYTLYLATTYPPGK